MAEILNRQQFYDMFITELQSVQSTITDTEAGSVVDIMAGVTAQVLATIALLAADEFGKTFFDSAHGPEVTGGADDLQALAVDHFGDSFARPEATKAGGTVTFSRANDDAGDCTIPAGTVVETAANSSGVKTRFVTTSEVTMTALSISATVEAETAGAAGNVLSGKIVSIGSTLTDSSITVTNAAAMSGGEDEEDDASYRDTIRSLLQSLKGATLAALEAKAKTVAGVYTATAIEEQIAAIEYNIGTGLPEVGATYFRMPYAKIYIADVNGSASSTLVDDCQEAIDSVRAAGVKVEVLGAAAKEVDWTAAITLNPSGPNFATLQSDTSAITDAMAEYIRQIAIGEDFERTAAGNAIMALFGPAGTDDITSFTTSVPTGDVDAAANEKLVPGTVEIA